VTESHIITNKWYPIKADVSMLASAKHTGLETPNNVSVAVKENIASLVHNFVQGSGV